MLADEMTDYLYASSKFYINRLDSDKIVGIEYFSSAAAENLESRFGHTNIRLIDQDDDPLNDLVISFEAIIPEAEQDDFMKYWRALSGHYPLYPVVRPMYMQIQLISYQKRNFLRLPIRLTKKERNRSLESLKNWINTPGTSPEYTFSEYNCVYGLYHMFELAKVHIGDFTRFPGKLPDILLENGRSTIRPISSLNIEGLFDKLVLLDRALDENNHLKTQKALKKLSLRETEIILAGIFPLTPKIIDLLNDKWDRSLKPATYQPAPLAEKLILKSYPACYYDFEIPSEDCQI